MPNNIHTVQEIPEQSQMFGFPIVDTYTHSININFAFKHFIISL